jgi:hypothetical protein
MISAQVTEEVAIMCTLQSTYVTLSGEVTLLLHVYE